MKFFFIICLLLNFSISAYGKNMFEVKIFGKLMWPDRQDMKNLNSIIGEFVSQEKLKRFEIISYGDEGGYRACIEPAPDASASDILKKLKSFKVNEKMTSYSINEVASCQ